LKEEKGLYEDIVEQATGRNVKRQYVSWRSKGRQKPETLKVNKRPWWPDTNGEEEWQRVVKERQTRVERKGKEKRGRGIAGGGGCVGEGVSEGGPLTLNHHAHCLPSKSGKGRCTREALEII